MAMSENMMQGGPAPTLPKNLEVQASMMQGGPAPALPPEMIAAIRELIEMGMSPSEAIDQMTKRVDPSAFGGKRMGALPPPMPRMASQTPSSMPPQMQGMRK